MGFRVLHSTVFKALVLALLISIGVRPALVHSQERPAERVDIPVENLERLIKTLETPDERQALLEDLKVLLASQKRKTEAKAPEKEKPNLIEWGIMEYDQMTREISGFFHNLFSLARRAPEGLTKTKAYLSDRENRAVLYRTVAIIGAGFATALVIILLIRRLTSALSARLLQDRGWVGRAKIYQAGIRMMIRITPYAALFVASLFVLTLLGIRGLLYQFALAFLLALLVYETVFNVSRILLSPSDPEMRVIPVADETSAYIWIWIRRFLNLWLIYYVATQSLDILNAPALLLGAVSKILILFFPVLSTMLLLQIRRMYAVRREARPRVGFWGRLGSYCVRFWPLATGTVIWLVSIFLIADYQEGIFFLVLASLKTLIAIALLWVALHVMDVLFNRLFRVSKEIKLRFPELEQKTNRYIGTVRRILKGVVIGIGIGTILEFWGIRTSWFVTSELGTTILSRAIAIAVTVGVILAIIDLSAVFANLLIQPRTDREGRVIEPGRKKKTLVPLFRWVACVASVFVGSVVILSQLGVNVAPILAGAGIVGLAVGFGAQSLVKDFISGLFLLFEDSVAVGDVVVVNGTGGLVEAVTLRTIRMRDLAGNVHVIPNGTVNMITNMTKEYSRYVFDVGVAYREDVDEVMAVLKEIGESLQNDPEYRDDILEPLEILGVDKFDDSAVVIKARITTKPIKQWRVGREFNRRMKKMFDERNIEIPFPHRTIHWGESKSGEAPPLAIQLSGQALHKSQELA